MISEASKVSYHIAYLQPVWGAVLPEAVVKVTIQLNMPNPIFLNIYQFSNNTLTNPVNILSLLGVGLKVVMEGSMFPNAVANIFALLSLDLEMVMEAAAMFPKAVLT